MRRHSRILGGDGSKSQSTNGKRCPSCGTITHKKGGLLGKKSIPLTVEGSVYQGRCLNCDPFANTPSSLYRQGAAVPEAVCQPQPQVLIQEERSNRRPSNGSGKGSGGDKYKNTNRSPPTAMVTTVGAATKSASRYASSRSTDSEQEQHQMNRDSEESMKKNRIKSNNESRLRDHHLDQQHQHVDPDDHLPLQKSSDHDEINDNIIICNEDAALLSAAILPSPHVAEGRVVASSSSKATTIGVPKTLEVIRREPNRSSNGSNNSNNLGDDYSVVSAITMDFHLFQSYHGGDDDLEDNVDYEDDNFFPPTSYHRRPGPERLNGRNYHSISQRNITNTVHSDNSDTDHHRERHRYHLNNNAVSKSNHNGRARQIPHQSHNRYSHPSRARPALASEFSPTDYHGTRIRNTHFPLNASSPAAAAIEPASNFGVKSDGENRNHINAHVRVSENHMRESQNPGTPIDKDDDFPSFMMDDNEHNYGHSFDKNTFRQQQELLYQQLESSHSRNRITGMERENIAMPQATVTPPSSASSSGPQFYNEKNIGNVQKRSNVSKNIGREEVTDNISDILQCLNLEECNPDIREEALCRLMNIMKKTGQNYYAGERERFIREFILENDVVEAITKSMWADMAIVEVQEAAMNILLFIAASADISYMGVRRDQQHSSNMLSKNESVCDSILFTMQNHATVHEIQLKGSLIFASLAASSSDCNHVGTNADGSLSGAMTMVLNAMSNHGDSRPIRKAGLQALHHQCLLSAYAEDNKRNLVESKLRNGMPAVDLIIYAMEELQQDLVAMEWACQLCWCLTSNENSLKQIEHVSLHEATMTICQHYMTKHVGIGMVEASIGTIANLAYLERKRSEMINTGAVELVLDGLRYHGDDFGISHEAALAMENFALPPYLPGVSSMLLNSEAVPLLIQGLKTFTEYPVYILQGLRALTSIAARCDEAREKICSIEVISIIQECSRNHRNADMLEICSIFVATLAMEEAGSVSDFMIKHEVVDLLLFAMEFSTEERVQDAACMALRNLSCHIQKTDALIKGDKTWKLIVSAMDTHRNSLSVQTNGCCIFLNLLSKTTEEIVFNPKIVISVTKAMQSHIESGELLELACGALWAVVDRFDDQKEYVGREAIDVVACAMVMHPGITSTLEKACGFFSNLSSEESLAKSIAKAQGVSIISEVMCNNSSSLSLLESGCLTLKNVVLTCPSFAQDGIVAMSTLVAAMNENVESTSFVKEACDVLWILASESESVRSKVLALDGISTLMKCLERNSNFPEVETSALGAFNQLAKVNNQKIV